MCSHVSRLSLAEHLLAFVPYFWYHEQMSKLIRGTKNKQKKVGRPVTTGKGMQIGMRWHKPLLGTIDRWAAGQDDKPGRPEAIRRLVQLGLATSVLADATCDAVAGRHVKTVKEH